MYFDMSFCLPIFSIIVNELEELHTNDTKEADIPGIC